MVCKNGNTEHPLVLTGVHSSHGVVMHTEDGQTDEQHRVTMET